MADDPNRALSVAAAAREAPETTALVDAGRETRWADLAAEVEREAARLRDRPAHEPVASVAQLDRATIVRFLACVELGRAFAPLHPRLPDGERARRAARVASVDLRRLGLPMGLDPEAPLALLFTSGSSGPAKLAVLSRRAFAASAHASNEAGLAFAPGDRWLLAMPLAHVGGLAILVRALAGRAAVAFDGPFEPTRFLDVLARDRVTHASLVPTMLARLVEAAPDRRPPPALRAALLGGAAAPPELVARARALGWPLRGTYGLTEACSQVATETAEDAGTGRARPLPGVRVTVAADGRVRVAGPTLFSGYVTPDGAGLEARPGDDGHDTGDLGRLGDDGALAIVGRASDVIVTGGENVHPAEVEAALEALPGVREVVVVGLPDPTWGEVVAAAFVGDADPEALAPALATRLAPHQVPRRFRRLAALPTHPGGKVDRGAVRAALDR